MAPETTGVTVVPIGISGDPVGLNNPREGDPPRCCWVVEKLSQSVLASERGCAGCCWNGGKPEVNDGAGGCGV